MGNPRPFLARYRAMTGKERTRRRRRQQHREAGNGGSWRFRALLTLNQAETSDERGAGVVAATSAQRGDDDGCGGASGGRWWPEW
ncbi:hypothetical protein L1987_70908 [Smallanthus sonchifolius]|uniref:Uncharacterized protein n=1 Tax=Smallanthus sonchifolius TaxID=185202 RepID=A0ACB9AQZ5_9ASTR|nr:hypothetical protein L1987_70908 [Smallanthus sonchifolius]